jgi:hypothetical protein
MEFLSSDYIGVTLIAKTSVKAKTYTAENAPDFDSFLNGDIVGKIYSWVLKNASIWWMFQNANGSFYFVKHETGYFEWADADNAIIRKNIVNRGGDVAAWDKEIRNKKIYSWGWKIGFSLGATYIIKKLIDTKIK